MRELFNEAKWKKTHRTIYVMQVIQVGFYKFMACFQRLERYISERSAMRRVYIVGFAISRAKYWAKAFIYQLIIIIIASHIWYSRRNDQPNCSVHLT